eukprot:TRINITY_DN24340_c0_g1_i3.p1 TRINITY_DN24340_c0_g1~~TRINITY_DN24340_c0_g1_i3.p1  ORF type:complete len:2415 (+),score=845.51 TRINITY_DN24340_c0_g1_i3:59-7303(+)
MPTSASGKGPDGMKELREFLKGIEAGRIPVNSCDADGRTPLHLACSLAGAVPPRQGRETVMFLLEMGANPQLVDSAGERAVDIAARLATAGSGVANTAALDALKEYAAASRKPQLQCDPMPAPCSELSVATAAQVCWSEVVPTIFYFLSESSATLRCHNVHTSQTYTLYQFPPRTAPHFYVVPYGDLLHRGRAADVVHTASGLLIGVDHSKVEPIVSTHQTPAAFDANTDSAIPLCTFIWVEESIGGPRAASEAERVAQGRRLRPSYLAAMRKELEELEKDSDKFQQRLARQPPPDPSYGLARNILLYPYGSDAPPAQQDAAEEEAETEQPSARGRHPWVAALVYVTTDAQGISVAAMHLAPFPTRRESEPAGVLAAAIQDASEELKMYDRLAAQGEEAGNLPPRAARHRLPAGMRPSCVGSVVGRQTSWCVVGAAHGGLCIYDTAKRGFVSAATADGPSTSGNAFEVLQAEEDDSPPLAAPPPEAIPGGCVVTSTDRGSFFTIFGSKVSLYKLSEDAAKEAPAPEMWLSAADAAAAGCVHPGQPHLVVFTRDGMLCWLDLRTRTLGVAGPLRLTEHEIGRKRLDGDLPTDDASGVETADWPSGQQRLCFSPDGMLLLRHNKLYGTCVAYPWAPIAAAIRRLEASVTVSFAPVDHAGCLATRCVGKETLRAHLSRLTSAGEPSHIVFNQLIALCRAVGCNGLPPNFRDSDGRTAVHHAALLCGCSDPARARGAAVALRWLLRRGGSIYCVDSAQQRPLDIAVVPTYTAGTHGTEQPVKTPSLAVLHRFREEQELGRRQRRDVPIIAELGEHCDQVCGSAVSDAVLYFASAARGEIVALNVEREFSAPLHAYPGVARMCVFPCSPTLHQGRRDCDYILMSDGTVVRVLWSSGFAEVPEVDVRRTLLRADVQPGVPCGCCLAATAVHRRSELGSEDHTVGIIGAVVTYVREHRADRATAKELRIIRLSSCLLPHDSSAISMLEFLGRAIDAAWEEESRSGGACTSLELPMDTVPAQMAAANTPAHPEGGLVVVFEQPPSDGNTVGYAFQGGSLTPIVASNLGAEGGTAGVALAPPVSGVPTLAVRFSRSVDLLPLRPQQRGGSLTEITASTQVPGGDEVAEMTAGAFHPHDPNILLCLREGDLCLHDCDAETTTVVSNLCLSDLELRRRAADGDGTDDDRITGPQSLSFTVNGMYLIRFNSFYNSFCVYAWADVDRARRRCGPLDWLVFLNTGIDHAAQERRPPRRMALRGNLKRVTTKRLSLREKQEEIETLSRAVEAAMVSANFRDADGKSVLHIVCDVAHLLPPEEVTRRVHWLLERGASLHSCDFDLCRPIDLLAVGGSGRAPFLSAIRLHESRHIHSATVDAPLQPFWESDLQVSQIACSVTDSHVIYALCVDGPPVPYDGRVAGAACGWRVVAIDVKRGRVDELASGQALPGRQRAAMLCVPYHPLLHAADPVDFLLLNTGVLVSVRRTPTGSASAEFATGVTFFAGIAATCVTGPRRAGTCCGADLMWVPASAQPPGTPKQGDGEHEEEEWDDMLGALCIATESDGAGVARTLRLPRVDYAEANPGKFLTMLLKLASPVEEPLPFNTAGDGPQGDVRISHAWRVSGGEFIVAVAGHEPHILSHRGASKHIPLGLSDPAASAGASTVHCYDGAVYGCFPKQKGGGCSVYSVVPNSPSQSSLVELWRSGDPASDASDTVAACFHPTAQQLLMLIDDELLCYHTNTGNTHAVRLVELGSQEREARSQEGDRDSSNLVGEQSLCFTHEGRHLCRLNLLYGRLVLYDWAETDVAIRGYAMDTYQTRNATHLSGLCATDPHATPVPRFASCLQPERRGNKLRKEALRGFCGRMSSAHGDSTAQRTCLLRLLSSIMHGTIGPNFVDADGRSALHLALQIADLLPPAELHASVSFLMKMGACLYLCDNGSQTPTDLLPRASITTRAGSMPALGAVQSVLEYHIRHFESDTLGPAVAKDTSGTAVVLGSFAPPPPVNEIPLCVSQVLPSPVIGGLMYCVAEHGGSAFVYATVAPRGVAPHAIFETTEFTASSLRVTSLPYHPAVANPRKGSLVLHDFLVVCDGTLIDVEVHVPEDSTPHIHSVSSAQTRLPFQVQQGHPVGFACAAVWDSEEGDVAEGYFARVVSSGGETRFEAKRLRIAAESAPGATSEELSNRLDIVLSALRGADDVIDAYLPSASPVVSMAVVPGRFVVTLQEHVPMQWVPGEDDVRPMRFQARGRGTTIIGATAPCDSKTTLAMFSRSMEVYEVSDTREKLSYYLDDAAEVSMAGCFHPFHPHLMLFTKDQDLCIVDLRQRTVKVVCEIKKGEREEQKSADSQVVALNLLSFTCDGSHLIRLNVYEEVASVYRWADIVKHLERINAEADVISNAVFLPPRLAGVDLQTVFQDVTAMLQAQRGKP